MSHVNLRTFTRRREPGDPRVELAKRLLSPPTRPSAIDELLHLEGREIDATLARAVDERRRFAVTLDALRARVVEIAAQRFLAERAEDDSVGEDGRILDFRPHYCADLYLAMACAARPRDNVAWNTLVLEQGLGLRRMARGVIGPAGEDEVNGFLADLWVERSTGACFLDTYRGLAPIRAWLHLVLRRRLLRMPRTVRTTALSDSIRDPANRDPGDDLARGEVIAALVPMVRALLRELPDRDRAFLEARLLRGEAGIDIAARHGVSPSYVSRRSRELVEALRHRLGPWLARLGVGPEDLR